MAPNKLSVVYVKNRKKSTFIPNKAKPMKALKNKTLLCPNSKLVIWEIDISEVFSLGYRLHTLDLALRSMAAAIDIMITQKMLVATKTDIDPVILAA